jgi:hypothetical protein
MQINAIRFKYYGDTENTVWRFTPGKRPGVYSLNAPQAVVISLMAAMRLLFDGKASTQITDAAIHITDDSGDVWIVERTTDKKRILRNGQLLPDSSIGEALIQSVIGFDGQELLIEADFSIDAEDLIATVVDPKAQPQKKLKNAVRQQIILMKSKITKIFDQPLIAEHAKQVQEKCEKLFYAYRELLRQRRSLLADFQSSEGFDEGLITQLEDDVSLIKEMERVTAPLVDPSQSPKNLKEKITKIETELSQQLRSVSTEEIPLPIAEIPWDKLVSCLSKIEAYEKLIQASERAQAVCQERLTYIQTNYIQTLDTLLSNDSQITAELESCLSSLSLQLSLSTKEPKPAVSDYILRFIRPTPEEVTSDAEKGSRLETARMAIDFALTRLGELHADLSDAKTHFDTIHQMLNEQHDNLLHEYGKLKNLWTKLSREHQLPHALTLSDLLRLCVRHVRINELHQSREQYRKIINERKQGLRRIEELLTRWRAQSHSQKENSLQNPAILIAEAQGVIRYREAKESQLQKLLELRENLRAFKALSLNIDTRESQIKTVWKQIFNDLSIPEVGVDRSGWTEFFGFAHQLASWQQIDAESYRSLAAKDMLKDMEAVLGIYHAKIPQAPLDNIFRLKLIESIQSQSFQGIKVICSDDVELVSLLTREGCGQIRKLTPKPKLAAKLPSQQLTKAQEMLTVLRGGVAK